MEKSSRKARCWSCQSTDTIKWGKQSGKQRYRCLHCGIYFTIKNEPVKRTNELIWFKKWVIYRQTLESISRDSGLSTRTLRRKFSVYLNRYPCWVIPEYRLVNLVVDGTYFSNKICLFIYRENELKETLLYRTTSGEYADEIYQDLINIMSLGIVIESVTCDGHKSIIRAIKDANKWIKRYNKEHGTNHGPILVQRCLVHVQRGCLAYLKKDHKSVEGRHLRTIAMTVCKIDSIEKRELFVNAFTSWVNDTSEYLFHQTYNEQSGRMWRTHKALYSAYNTIKNALPCMFHYLNNTRIPRTTNCLEGFFSHLKDDISFHRGLSREHFKNFLRWYIWFKNQTGTGFS